MRLDLVTVATKRSGLSAAIASAMPLVKAFTASQLGLWLQRRHDMQALAAGGLDEAGQPGVARGARAPRRPRRSPAVQATPSPGSRSMMIMSGRSRSSSCRAPGVDFEHAALDQPDQPGEAVDGDDRLVLVLRVVRLRMICGSDRSRRASGRSTGRRRRPGSAAAPAAG